MDTPWLRSARNALAPIFLLVAAHFLCAQQTTSTPLALEAQVAGSWVRVFGVEQRRLIGGDTAKPVAIPADAPLRIVGDLAANLDRIEAVTSFELDEIPAGPAPASATTWKAMAIRSVSSDIASPAATARFQTSDPRRCLLLCVWQVRGVPVVIKTQPLMLRAEGTNVVEEFDLAVDAASISGNPLLLVLADGAFVARNDAADAADLSRFAARLALGLDSEVAAECENQKPIPASASMPSALHLAAQAGALRSVEALLKTQSKPQPRDASGNTPLHLAVRCMRPAVAATLIGAKVPCDAANNDGQTALHLAAIGAHVDTCQMLLDAGATPTVFSNKKDSPILCALYSNCVPAIELLKAHGADFNFTGQGAGQVLVLKAWQGQRELVRLLLPHTAQLSTIWRGQTALMAAASEGHLEILDDLLAAKANPNHPGLAYRTPLIAAASRGRADAVRKLLAAGAKPDMPDAYGRTPLHAACFAGSAASAKILLEAGASIDPVAADGATPLSLALEAGSLPTVELLIASSARVDPAAPGFDNSLSRALTIDSEAFVAAALKAGMAVSLRTSSGWTALQIAKVMKATRCIALLTAAGADTAVENASVAQVIPPSQLAKRPAIVEIRPPVDPRDPNESDLKGETVMVDTIIDGDGKPVFARATCEDCRLSASAMRTVLRSVFTPAQKDGKQVTTQVRIPVRFLAREELVFSAESLDKRPVPISQISPRYPTKLKIAKISGEATVDFVVATDGSIQDVTVVSASHTEFGASAVLAVKQWLFQPGIHDGKPAVTTMRCTFPFRIDPRTNE